MAPPDHPEDDLRLPPVTDVEALETSIRRYDQAVTAIEQPVADLYAYSRRSRIILLALCASLAFNLVLSVVVAVVAVKAREAAAAADALSAQVAQTGCRARNDFKELDRKRWDFIIALAAEPDPEVRLSKAQKALAADRARRFRNYIDQANALEDCSRLPAPDPP